MSAPVTDHWVNIDNHLFVNVSSLRGVDVVNDPETGRPSLKMYAKGCEMPSRYVFPTPAERNAALTLITDALGFEREPEVAPCAKTGEDQ